MRTRFFVKLLSGYFIVLIGLTTVILLFSVYSIRNHYIKTLENNLKNVSLILEPQITQFIQNRNYSQLDSLVKYEGEHTGIRITIIKPDGTVIADSRKNPAIMENHRNRPEVVTALSGNIGRSLRFSTTVKEKMMYIARPIIKNNQIIGIIRVSLFVRDINKLINSLTGKIILSTLILLAISSLISYILSRNLYMPLKTITEAAQEIANGKLDTRIDIKNRDEFGILSRSFNEMTEKLQMLFNDIKTKEEELREIINSLKEGLCVIDNNNKIILFNKKFETITDTNPFNKFFWEVIKSPEISNIINSKKETINEIKFNDKIFLITLTKIENKNEIILVFHDITELKKIEQIKKDFVANVSHELRTPLTAIKGYIETLEDEITGENLHYLKIIKKHTNRIINMVEDLLSLSRIEDLQTRNINMKNVDIYNIASDVIRIFKSYAEEKGLSLTIECENKNTLIKGDPFLIEQMLINLIENALKYTDKGNVTVKIYESNNTKDVILEVSDTGIGIPENQIDRIFERFYVVDKSRSRKMGGTGLGLSIVKHIVLLHNAKIEVESKEKKGSTFRVTFHKIAE